MHYFEEDVYSLVSRSPYLSLSRARSAEAILRRAVEAGEELERLLHEYPNARYESLEFFYTCLNGLGAINVTLLNDMIDTRNWRAIVWASFYTALDPRPEYAPLLQSIEIPLPYNRWLVDLGMAELGIAPQDPATEQVRDLIRRVRHLLTPVPRPSTLLRTSPSSAQLDRLHEERNQISNTYRIKGTDAALAKMQGTLSAYFAASYRTWVANGCPPPPS